MRDATYKCIAGQARPRQRARTCLRERLEIGCRSVARMQFARPYAITACLISPNIASTCAITPMYTGCAAAALSIAADSLRCSAPGRSPGSS